MKCKTRPFFSHTLADQRNRILRAKAHAKGEIKTVEKGRKWHEVTYQSRTPQTQEQLTAISWKKVIYQIEIRWKSGCLEEEDPGSQRTRQPSLQITEATQWKYQEFNLSPPAAAMGSRKEKTSPLATPNCPAQPHQRRLRNGEAVPGSEAAGTRDHVG